MLSHRYQDMQHQATSLEETDVTFELKNLSLVLVLKVVLLQTGLSMAKAC
jgi:hypothetical protein